MSSKGRFTADLEALIGGEATRKLIERYGNRFVCVPQAITADHPLADLLGREEAERLSYHYGGMRLLIPKGYELSILERNRAIREASAAGATGPELAQRFDLSHRRIRAILHQPPPTAATLPPALPRRWARQLSLF